MRLQPTGQRFDRGVVRKPEALVGGEAVLLPHLSKDLRLLHRVDAQVGLELVVQLQLVHRVPGLLRDHRQQIRQRVHIPRHCGRLWRRCGRHGRGSAHRFYGVGRRRDHRALRIHLRLQPTGQRFDRGVVRKPEALVGGEAVLLPHLSKDLRLLHRVDAQVGFEFVVRLQLIGAVAGLLRNDGQQLAQHIAGRTELRRGLGRLDNGRLDARIGRRRLGDPQVPLVLRQRRLGQSADPLEPLAVRGRVGDSVFRVGQAFPCQQCQLGAESRRQANSVSHRHRTSAGQSKIAKVRVGLLQVGNGRNPAILQGFQDDRVFDARTHWVTGESFGVRHHNVGGSGTECAAQALDLRSRRAAFGGRVGLVTHEHGRCRELVAGHASPLHRLGDQGVHFRRDVLGIQARSMKGRVGESSRQQAPQRHNAPGGCGRLGFDHKPRGSHAQDHAVAAGIERECGILDHVLGRGGTGGQKSGSYPFHQGVRGHIVRTHHNHAFAPAHANPVRCHRHSLGGARTGSVGGGIGALCADVLRKLRVPHGEHLKQESPIKVAFVIATVCPHVLGKLVVSRECGRKNHPCGAAHLLGQLPSRRHLLAASRGVKGLHQGNLGILERLDPRRKRQLSGDVECANPLGVNAVLFRQVEGRLHAGQSNDFLALLDGLEGALAGLGVFVNPNDLFGQKAVLCGLAEPRDSNFTVQDARHIVGSEHLFAAGQPDRCAGADHADGSGNDCRCRAGSRRYRCRGGRRKRRRHGGGRRQRCRSRFEHGLNQSPNGGQDGRRELIGVAIAQTGARRPFGQCRQSVVGKLPSDRRPLGPNRNPAAGIHQHLLNGGGLRGPQSTGGVVGEIPQRPMLTQSKAGIVVQAEPIPNVGDDLGLLDGIDPQVRFQLIVQIQFFR